MRVDVYFHMGDDTVETKLDQVINMLHDVLLKEAEMAGELDALKAAVAAEDTVIQSAIVLLQGLKAALDAAIASNNPADLVALSADIGAQTAALSAAITTNTPTP